MDPDPHALHELLSLYYLKFDLSEYPTDQEIETLRYETKYLLASFYPIRLVSCLVEYHVLQYNSTKVGVYYMKNNQIHNWENSNQPFILYFHGGEFAFGNIDIDTYSGYECHLSKYQNMLIVHVEIRQVYQFLFNVDFNIHQRLIGMSDASGGMLWIYLLQWIVSNNKPVPQGVVLHSPWSHLDFTEENLYDYRDNILSVQLALNLRKIALGKTTYWFELTNEQVKKINQKRNAFEGFPPLYIHVTAGTNEILILIGEIRRMVKKINLASGQVILDEGIGLMHTYALFHMWIFKGKCVRQNIRKWIHVILPMHVRSTLNMAEIETNSQNIRKPGLCT
ncbi:unnamed protein product [Rotaria socialis]|uniref:Uncharacterized protein n=1 Tax=Rotaria socialis TaxID=392032 RepID=A0A817XU93_9BILA|nr:unnamed protein product [Rotaria socialis]CAF4874845.1 unnamed protein product [Rotaria socialis]